MHVIYAVINHFQASDDMHRKYVTKVTLLRYVIDNYSDIPRRRPMAICYVCQDFGAFIGSIPN